MPPARPPHWAVFLDLLLGFFLFFSSAFKLHPILLFPLGGSSTVCGPHAVPNVTAALPA